MSNAIEYTSDEEIVIGAVSDRGGGSKCWVRDTGKGIPEERLGRVFDKLETDPKRGGLGLGLAIVKQIVEAHGGNITVKSTRGEGSTFEFSIPLQSPTGVPIEMSNGTAA